MKDEPYIKAGRDGRDFYFAFSLLDYEDVPIVFVARDERWQLYLCDCTEFRFSMQHWTIAKTTIEIIKKIISGEMSVCSALCAMEDDVILADCDLETDVFTQKHTDFDLVPDVRLPKSDSMLDCMDDGVRHALVQFETEWAIHAVHPNVIPDNSMLTVMFDSSDQRGEAA